MLNAIKRINTAKHHHAKGTQHTHVAKQGKAHITFPSSAAIAAEASSPEVKLTKPKPLDLPVSRSMMTLAAKEKETEISGYKENNFKVGGLVSLQDLGQVWSA